MTVNPAIDHVLQFFRYDHLPAHLQLTSKRFTELAFKVADDAPDSRETTTALRKLLEAKDAAVRAQVEIAPVTTPGEAPA